MYYERLRSELITDPIAIGYASMTDTEASVAINDKSRGYTIEREVIPAYEIFEATVLSELSALTGAAQTRYFEILGMGMVHMQGQNARTVLGAMFPAGSQTRANVLALQRKNASRAEVAHLGQPEPIHVTIARSL